jgi:alkaline phosphatase D
MGRLTRRSRGPRGLSRRTFLQHAGAGLATAPLIAACSGSDPGSDGRTAPPPGPMGGSPFLHGVASGDPLSDRVVFWTRVTTTESSVPVTLRVYSDPALGQQVAQTQASAGAARDHTVKIDQAGLAPGTTYYYQFEALGHRSPIGRTRTAPAGGVTRLRFGVVSCSSAAHGFFNAYRFLAQRADLDAILHLGDYIYEYGNGQYGDVRTYEPEHEMVTLPDYRTRHAFYKRDPDLMELHRQFPFITIWDDHESTDNSWRDGAVNHTEGAEGSWVQRKAWAQQAYDEWMPIRYPEAGNVSRIWRKLSYGNLAELFLLDTRLYDRDVPFEIPVTPLDAADDPDRRLIGPEQRQWLLDGLTGSSATWKLIGNQVVMMQWTLTPGLKAAGGPRGLNGDSWDGYMAERQMVIDGLRAGAVNNVVILTGDVHSSWVGDITDDPNNPLAYNPVTGAGSVATEFVVTSVTSPGALPAPNTVDDGFRAINPQIKYLDLTQKGYSILDLTPERALCEYWYVSTVTESGGSETFATAFPVAAGSNRVGAATGASAAPESPSPLAPAATAIRGVLP